MAGIFAFLTWDARPVPIGARVDDWHYVAKALSIARLDWLGTYNETTLVKRPLFSLVLAIPYLLHIPYSLFLYSLVFITTAFLALSVQKIGLSKWLAVGFFLCLLFLPTFVDRESMRVVRDPVFICVQLLILGLVFQIMGTPRIQENRRRRRFLFACFFSLLALHAGMREEAVIFYPGLLAILLYYVRTLSNFTSRMRWVYGLRIFLAGIIAFQGSLFAIRVMNFAYYRVFILDEHEEGDFPEAMAALASVRKPGSTSRTLIAAPERKELNSKSPLFRKIGWILDVPDDLTPPDCVVSSECENNDYSHSIFGMRTSTFPSLQFQSAREAQQFYRDLRSEIVTLCESKQIPCELPVRKEMRPPFRSFNLPYWREAVRVHLNYLAHFTHRAFRPYWHEASPDAIRDFETVTHQRYFMVDDKTGKVRGSIPAPLETVQRQVRRREAVSEIYTNYGPYFLAAGVLLFGLRLCLIPFWGVSAPLAVSIAVVLMIAARMAVVTYISAVDNLMSQNYTVHSYSLLILFCFLSFSAVAEAASRIRSIRR
jgi:hypothetical protein